MFQEAQAELSRTAMVGRSDPAVYAALAAVGNRRFDLGRDDPDLARRYALLAASLQASDRQIATSPGLAAGYTRRAHALVIANSTGIRFGGKAALNDACVAATARALARDPADALALDLEAGCLLEGNQLEAGAAAAAGALRVAPGFPWAANDLCVALYLSGEQRVLLGRDALVPASRAIEACRLASALDPDFAFPPSNSIMAYATRIAAVRAFGVWDAAAAAAGDDVTRRALAMPLNWRVVPLANHLMLDIQRVEHEVAAGRDAAAARAKLLARIAQIQAEARAGWLTGEVSLMLHEARATALLAPAPAEAAREAAGCLGEDPRRLLCRQLAIRAAWATGDLPRALDLAAALVRDVPASGRGWAALAETHLRRGRPTSVAAGLAAAVTAVAVTPVLADGHAVLGRLLWRAGQPGPALAALERAVAQNALLAPVVAEERRAAIAAALSRASAGTR